MHLWRNSWLLIGTLLCLCPNLHAQTLPFHTYLDARRDSNFQVKCVRQAPSGLLMLGTDEGAFYFDGTDVWPVGGACTLNEEVADCMYSESNGMLLATPTGLYGCQQDTFLRPEDANVIFQDDADRVWVGTNGRGVVLKDAGEWKEFERMHGMKGLDVSGIAQGNDDRIWIATEEGLHGINRAGEDWEMRSLFEDSGLPDVILTSLVADLAGKLFIGTFDRGVCAYNPNANEWRYPADPWTFGEITSLWVEGRRLWVGTKRHGLVLMHAGTLEVLRHVPPSRSFPVQHVFDIFGDNQGNLWVSGARKGILCLRPDLLPVEDHQGKLAGPVESVLETSEGWVWVAQKHELYRFRVEEGAWPELEALPTYWDEETLVVCMYELPDGNMVLGTDGAGVFILDPRGRLLDHLTERDGLANNSVLHIAADEEHVWFATFGGLSSLPLGSSFPLRKSLATKMSHFKDLGLHYIYTILPDSRGRIWLGSVDAGVTVFQEGKVKQIGEESGIEAPIYSICEDNAGTIWMGGEDGLYRYRQGKLTHWNENNGLGEATVSSVMPIRSGELLVVHSEGIDMFEDSTESFVSLTEQMDLLSFDPNLNVVAKGKGYRRWVGSESGLYLLDPTCERKMGQPQMIWRDIQLFLEESVDTSHQRFSFNENHLAFSFKGLWYRDPDHVEYRHRLIGQDIDWVGSRESVVQYPRLRPGRYIFEVQGAVHGQFQHAETLTYTFIIGRPFWQTPWFWGLLMVFAGLGIYAWVKYRERQLERKSSLERAHISFQLQTLKNQINPHFLFNSLNTLVSVIEEDEELAITYVNHLSDLMRAMLTVEGSTLIPLRQELELLEKYSFLLKQRFGEHLKVQISIPEKVLNTYLPPLTLQMLMENVIKHNVISSAKKMEVKLEFVEDQWLIVENPVRPKRTSVKSTGVGLRNIKERYRLLGRYMVDITHTQSIFRVRIPLIPEEEALRVEE
ncbi:two-component regulator propeller domain-containing protein [Pontibacter sp. G13]|uniref:two-component regulator propeller domain-containing protein n=1 Tax=Pontibacter sp. G13 TaxID=3074898 RepID=UPI00288C05BF|nr:two-component regulator propeller domain-containing protein [Pontibacter sp. G13]WNJ18112.1 two-component regulator propeller domain-containing protein [Pontibacter sp. G13]